MRRTTMTALALALLVLPACSTMWRARSDRSMTVGHVADAAVLIESENGGIDLTAKPDREDVLVEARITCSGASQEEADRRAEEAELIVERDADGRLVIRPSFPGGERNGDGASFTVEMPGAHGVEAYSSNGGVKVTGTSGELEAASSNGSIVVTDHDGPARCSTSNGRVTITNLAGPARVATSNGSISVGLRHDQTGPVDLRSSNGSVRLRVGPSFAGLVTMKTSNGGVRVSDHAGITRMHETRRNRGRVQFSEGGEPSSMRTSNGAVEVRVEE
jgi:hypothetical protein